MTNISYSHRVKITFKINLVIFITGFLMFCVVLVYDVNYFRYKSPIPYSNIENITFDDFTGLKRPNQTLYGNNKFAFISLSINVKENRKSIEITTYFYPASSYVYIDGLQNDRLLKHELYHFNITEYCSRMLRSEVSKNPNFIPIDKYLQIEDSLQREYDYETSHSYVMSKQVEWENKIDSCLKSLDNYKKTIILKKR